MDLNIIIDWFKTNWMQITIIALAISKVLAGLRDAIDETPETDDNAFERFCTIINKFIGYLFLGKRSKNKGGKR